MPCPLGTCGRRWRSFCYDVGRLQRGRLALGLARAGIGRRGEVADGSYDEEKIENGLLSKGVCRLVGSASMWLYGPSEDSLASKVQDTVWVRANV